MVDNIFLQQLAECFYRFIHFLYPSYSMDRQHKNVIKKYQSLKYNISFKSITTNYQLMLHVEDSLLLVKKITLHSTHSYSYCLICIHVIFLNLIKCILQGIGSVTFYPADPDSPNIVNKFKQSKWVFMNNVSDNRIPELRRHVV